MSARDYDGQVVVRWLSPDDRRAGPAFRAHVVVEPPWYRLDRWAFWAVHRHLTGRGRLVRIETKTGELLVRAVEVARVDPR